MKLKLRKSRFSFCTTAVAGDDTADEPPTVTTTAPTTTLLPSNLSLQTLPSVPSLSSLLDPTPISLTPSLHASLSLSSRISSLSLHNNHIYAASGHTIHVLDHSTLSPLTTFNSHNPSSGAVKSLAFHKHCILTAHQDGKIRVWKLPLMVKNKKGETLHHKFVSSLPTVADKLVRYPIPKNHVQVRRHRKRLWVEHHDAVSGLAVSSGGGGAGGGNVGDGSYVYSVSWDKTLKTWGPGPKFKCLESLTAHTDAVNALAVSFDGVVFTGSADGRIRVWGPRGKSNNGDDGDGEGKNDVGEGKSKDKKKKFKKAGHEMVATLEKHKSAVNALALSSDGKTLFSGACDRSILVWEREDNAGYMAVSGALRGHEGAILCLINVADFLISGSADRTVRIWRRGFEGRFSCLAVLVGHLKPVKALTGKVMEDGGIMVFSGGLDGEIKVWKIKVNSLCDVYGDVISNR